MSQSSQSSLGEGVYFPREAYAGLGRRFAIMAIDGLVVFLAGFPLNVLWFPLLLSDAEAWTPYYFYSWIGVAYVYLVFVERSSIGTLGFMITGVRILNLKGEQPSFLRMTLRLLLWILGPFNPLIDLIWLGGDEFRQTLRDKFAGTIVVKRGAVPAGRGPVHVRYYAILGFMLAFAEVQKPRPSQTSE